MLEQIFDFVPRPMGILAPFQMGGLLALFWWFGGCYSPVRGVVRPLFGVGIL